VKLKPFIERIISEIGPRPAGSTSEYRAGEIIADELRKRTAEVRYHDTTVCPNIIHGLINMMIGVYLFSALIFLFLPLASAIIIGVLLTALLLMRIFGNRVIDWLFHSTPTRNIIGIFRPKGMAEKILIFSGHHDSPNMMPLFSQPYKPYIHLFETVVLVCMGLLIPSGIIRTITSGPATLLPSLGWFDLLYAVSLVGLIPGFFYRFKMISPERNLGANDNLSSVAVLLGIADHLKKKRLKKTEVWLISFGSEEPLIYGSAGFARDFPDLIKKAVHFNMETLGAGDLAVIRKEKMTMTAYTPEVIAFIQRAGKRAGFELPAIDITYGGTDSYPIIKAGGRSACLFGMDETELFSLWHCPDDNPDNIDENNLQKALQICIEAIREYDEEG